MYHLETQRNFVSFNSLNAAPNPYNLKTFGTCIFIEGKLGEIITIRSKIKEKQIPQEFETVQYHKYLNALVS